MSDLFVCSQGEYSDFQHICDSLHDVVLDEREQNDGATLGPANLFALTSQMM
jgi:hypothetical protein